MAGKSPKLIPNSPAAPAPIRTPAASMTYHSGWTTSSAARRIDAPIAASGGSRTEKTYHAIEAAARTTNARTTQSRSNLNAASIAAVATRIATM